MKIFSRVLFFSALMVGSVVAVPMRFGRTDSPAAFRVDLPGSWARSKIEGCYEDIMGSRLQAIMAENPERTVENTYPKWKQDFKRKGYEVYEVSLQGAPALIARGSDNTMGIVLHRGYQVNLMLNISNQEVNMDELLDRMAKTFQWLVP